MITQKKSSKCDDNTEQKCSTMQSISVNINSILKGKARRQHKFYVVTVAPTLLHVSKNWITIQRPSEQRNAWQDKVLH